MLGSGDPTPYDAGLFIALLVIVGILTAGAFTNAHWAPNVAAYTRRAAVLLAFTATAIVFLRTPGGGSFAAAGRLVTIGPALAAVVVAYLVWSWRSGRF
jgi:hypothetical protein